MSDLDKQDVHYDLEQCLPCDQQMTATINSNCGLCFQKLFKNEEVRTHLEHNSRLLVTKSKITAVCEDHGSVSITRFGNAETRTDLRTAVGLFGDQVRRSRIMQIFSDDVPANSEYTDANVLRMQELVNEFAQCHSLRKVVGTKDGYILHQREGCPYDYEHFDPKLNFKGFWQRMNRENPEFRDLTRKKPIYKQFEQFMLVENEECFPILQRCPEFDAVHNGLVFYVCNNSPGVRFISYEQAKKMKPQPGVCRKYIDQDFKSEWLQLFHDDRGKFFREILPLTYGILDVQGMHDDVQMFNIRGREMTDADDDEWSVGEGLRKVSCLNFYNKTFFSFARPSRRRETHRRSCGPSHCFPIRRLSIRCLSTQCHSLSRSRCLTGNQSLRQSHSHH
jgi:hypothetical protein